ncbi:MAG TPA: tyrosine--tRNA ligase [Nevskiaceae bacterium]|nr:tyrosine--tRNA ligase [Nevskiaceae bacterium]
MADMTLSEELQWRGFVNQSTFSDLTELDKQQWTFYHGFDASANSQTVGNLAAMMFDKVFMRHGHKAILLAGGATSLIGDPGGKDSERVLQDEQTIAHNVACAEEQLKKVFTGYDFTLVNNLDWTKDLRVMDFLRDIGKHFSMTPLVQRDYIAKRLGEGGAGISYTEFSYTLLQGMDFLHLFDKHGVTLQLGGADQWGNCLSGVDLIRRTRGKEAHVITLPLTINKATGKKFGKSEEGAVWLDSAKTTPYKFYQFWLNADDEGVEGYLKIFTELDKAKIDQVMHDFNQNRASRIAQKTLAYEITKLVHGQDQAEKQVHIAEAVTAQSLDSLNDAEVATLRREIPHATAAPGSTIADVLVAAGLASSKTEARRFIADNAVSINGQKTAKEQFEDGDFHNGRLLLRRGKAFKDSALVERS